MSKTLKRGDKIKNIRTIGDLQNIMQNWQKPIGY